VSAPIPVMTIVGLGSVVVTYFAYSARATIRSID
jgi:hypothetical protein